MAGCSAHGCSNSAAKGFLMKTFPRDPEKRKMWAAKIRRKNWQPTNFSVLCEVHFEKRMWEKTRVDGKRKLKHDALPTLFNFVSPPVRRKKLEEDMDNYVRFKLMGGIKKLKPNVVPHKFDCQLDKRHSKLSAASTSTSSKEDPSVQMDQENTHSVQLLSDVNGSPEQSTIAVTETCVKNLKRKALQPEAEPGPSTATNIESTPETSRKNSTEDEDSSFYHSNQPAFYNVVETEMDSEIDNDEIEVKYQPFTTSLDQIKEEIDIDDYNSPSDTHQLKKRKFSHQFPSRTESDTHIDNPMEDNQTDEWHYFGNNIACQLRNLPLERALMCQQKILDILTQDRIDFVTKMKTEETNTAKED